MAKLKIDTNAVSEELKLYKKKLEKLQESLVDKQIENSTLQSQSTSLLSQINQLQSTQSMLETSKKKLEEAEKGWKTERDDLLRDQVGLQKVSCD